MKLHSVMSDGVKVPEDGSNYVIGPWLTFDADKEIHPGPPCRSGQRAVEGLQSAWIQGATRQQSLTSGELFPRLGQAADRLAKFF
ncbi:MAG: hypothetical protein Ct9H300mP32_3650 [Verrucomicrobiota bacterium]|nr:MAG: hypothetical protein Ct9H300mP32_3650 [Verrucomicrobiota bacterium]